MNQPRLLSLSLSISRRVWPGELAGWDGERNGTNKVKSSKTDSVPADENRTWHGGFLDLTLPNAGMARVEKEARCYDML